MDTPVLNKNVSTRKRRRYRSKCWRIWLLPCDWIPGPIYWDRPHLMLPSLRLSQRLSLTVQPDSSQLHPSTATRRPLSTSTLFHLYRRVPARDGHVSWWLSPLHPRQTPRLLIVAGEGRLHSPPRLDKRREEPDRDGNRHRWVDSEDPDRDRWPDCLSPRFEPWTVIEKGQGREPCLRCRIPPSTPDGQSSDFIPRLLIALFLLLLLLLDPCPLNVKEASMCTALHVSIDMSTTESTECLQTHKQPP